VTQRLTAQAQGKPHRYVRDATAEPRTGPSGLGLPPCECGLDASTAPHLTGQQQWINRVLAYERKTKRELLVIVARKSRAAGNVIVIGPSMLWRRDEIAKYIVDMEDKYGV
jgi:hypothetical protein